MTDDEVRAALTDIQAAGLTTYGEARGEPDLGRRGVLSVIRNRVLDPRWPDTFRGVVFQPWQFSCWSPKGGAANYAVVMAMARALVDPSPTVLPASLRACLALAEKAVAGTLDDPTGGATHYLERTLYAQHPPAWALRLTMTCEIARHVFLK